MYRVTETYKTYRIEVSAKYKCICGHKMTRKNVATFTMSPLNKYTFKENQERCMATAENMSRTCPKCGADVLPVVG